MARRSLLPAACRFLKDSVYLAGVTIGNVLRPRRLKGEAQSILVICTAGIGDALWSTPVLRALRTRYPRSAIAVLVSEKRGTRQVFEASRYVDECIVVDWDYRSLSGLARLLRLLRARRFDMTVSTFPGAGFGSRALAWLIGASSRAGYGGLGWRFLLTQAIRLKANQHTLNINLDIARAVGNADEAARLDLTLDERDRSFAEEFIRGGDILPGETVIAVHPGGFPDIPEKAWPPERFAQLIDILQEDEALRVLLFAGPQDEERVDAILSQLHGRPPLLATGLTLRQMAAVFEKCALLITNDCGPLRVAEAVGLPAVALFGPTDPALVGPYEAWADKYVVINKGLPCAPCYRHKPIHCPFDTRCMTLITAEEVAAAAKALLEHRRPVEGGQLLGERQHVEV